jgi:hypothetical protein
MHFRCNRIVFPAFPVEPVSWTSDGQESAGRQERGADGVDSVGRGKRFFTDSLVKGFAR